MMNFEKMGKDLGTNTDKLDKNKEAAMLPKEKLNLLRSKLTEKGNRMLALADKFNILIEEDYTKTSNAPMLRDLLEEMNAAERDKEEINKEINSVLEELKDFSAEKLQADLEENNASKN